MPDVTCWSCGGATSSEAALRPLLFVRCVACGLVFKPDEDVEAVYEDGDYEQAWAHEYEAEDDRRSDARVRLGWLAGWATTGRLLDVGAAGGEFVAEAGAAGFTATGLEPTPGFAERAREHLGVDVATGTIADADLPTGALDVVTLWHVLEHIPHPRAELERLRTALRPGGVLAIEVPNYGGRDAERDGPAWASLQPDVHVNQFAPPSLLRLLELAGFEVRRVETTAVTPYMAPGERFAPRHVVARAKAAAALRDPRTVHPSGHELLRAAAVVPG